MKFPSLNKAKPPTKDDFVEAEKTDNQIQEEQQCTMPQMVTTVVIPQDNNIKFEENKTYITKILTLAGLPLVLRSEQNMIFENETRQEILSLLEENNKIKEDILKADKPIGEEDEYILRIANFHYLTGSSQIAVDMYEYILKRNPDKMAALNNKGVVFDSIGEYDKALGCFNEALTRVPENVHVLSNKGISLYKSERYEQALECFDAALKIDNNYVNALTFKGHSLYRLGKNNDALDLYNKVIRLDHNNAEALYNKACLCSIKGDEYGSITSLERAIRLDASWKDTASHDKDLDRVSIHPRFRKIVK